MELRHLRYFVAVAETLSFRGAAERLRLSQPALSKQIRDLEEMCGTRLFDRDTTRVDLTDAGVALLQEARLLVARADRLPALVREAAAGRRGQLSIGAQSSVTAAFLPAALAAFHSSYPEVEVNLVELRHRAVVTALREHRLHLGFVPASEKPCYDGLEVFEVLRSPCAVFMSRQHALARRRDVRLEELVDESFLAVVAEPAVDEHADFILNLFTNAGVRRPRLRRTDALDSLFALVGSNQGISIMPQAAAEYQGSNLVARPLLMDNARAWISTWCLWRQSDMSPLARNFVQLLTARVATEAAHTTAVGT
jgi:DNA-binding transcriptional LysR family regulator